LAGVKRKKRRNKMTIQEIEEKFGGKYHKGVIAKNIEAMWDIIGNNYDIEIEQLPTFSVTYIIIPDELCS
jgi:phosphoenolpyruvate synthase/pyruvate phosphate dikinase